MSLFSFGLGATGTGGGGGETIYLYPEHSLIFEQEDFAVQFDEAAYTVSYGEEYEIDIQVFDDEDGISVDSGDNITHVT